MKSDETGMKISRRTCLMGLAASSMSPGSACAGDGEELHIAIGNYARRLPAPRHGRLRMLIPGGSDANIAPITQAFHELTGIEVEVVSTQVRDVATAMLLDGLLDERAYDIALPPTFDLPDLVAANALQSFEPFSDARDAFRAEDDLLYSEGDGVDGEAFGYQTDGDAYLMFFNRRFFEDARVSSGYEDNFGEPFEIPHDWATLDRQIMHISSLGDGRKGALLARRPGYVEWEWWLRLHARGRWPLSRDLTPQIADDEGIGVLEDMIRIKPSLQPERGGLNELFLRWEDFEKGNIYTTLSWGGSQKFHMRPESSFAKDLVHGLIPGGTGANTPDALPYFNWGWSYTVPASTADAELAHAFCLFAVTPEMSLSAVRRGDGFFDPFRGEHYDDRIVQDIYSRPFLRTHRISMERAMPDFYVTDRADYFTSLASWIGLALNGHATPEDAMKQVSEAWNVISNRSDRDRKITQWNRLRAKYPPEIASRLRDLTPA